MTSRGSNSSRDAARSYAAPAVAAAAAASWSNVPNSAAPSTRTGLLQANASHASRRQRQPQQPNHWYTDRRVVGASDSDRDSPLITATGSTTSLDSGSRGNLSGRLDGSSDRLDANRVEIPVTRVDSGAVTPPLAEADIAFASAETLRTYIRQLENSKLRHVARLTNQGRDLSRKLDEQTRHLSVLREATNRQTNETSEMKELCCFLDDERQKGKKLAREWQRFGRYTSSVMKSEVATYQDKLGELEEKQQALLTENSQLHQQISELKELVLLLDSEKDESSATGSNAPSPNISENGSKELLNLAVPNGYNRSLLQYIQHLENRVNKLELEKSRSGDNKDVDHHFQPLRHAELSSDSLDSIASKGESDRNKPEAVVKAMKVLEVHERLGNSATPDVPMQGAEMDVLRQMCNVAWRKLGDQSDGETSQSTKPNQVTSRPTAPADSTALSTASYRAPFAPELQYSRPVERPRPTRPPHPGVSSTLSGPRPPHPAAGATSVKAGVRHSRVHSSSPVRHRLDTQF